LEFSVGYDDLIELKRDLDAVAIPQGDAARLSEHEKVYLIQTLGGAFTVQRDDGQLVRVAGKDADALGLEVPAEATPPEKPKAGVEGQADEKAVWDAMRTCYDPEIPVNIVDLGLVYSCRLSPAEGGGTRVDVVMTLTAPGCGMADVIKSDVEQKIRVLPGVAEAFVDVTFDPPWNRDMMTDAAKLQLGMY
jgi:probable FeS assembly SUF system protein SufT